MAKYSLIDDWLSSEDQNRSKQTYELKKILTLQEKFLFSQYEPVNSMKGVSGLPFINRVESWLSSFKEMEDQWAAFHALKYFLFIGIKETEELYRCAVRNHLYPWIVEENNLDIFSSDLSSDLNSLLQVCWPCPVTDSLRINSLLHRTGLSGQPLRPDWLSLSKLGSPDKIRKYVERKNFRYLVLFEDFVGSGSQCESIVQSALEVFDGKIFLAPLVVCHPGDHTLRTLQAKESERLIYSPVTVLGADCLVREHPQPGEPMSFAALRTAMLNGSNIAEFAYRNKDGPYGFNGVGCLFSSYSNCPNNTPPIYFRRSETWKSPIFPRNSRV